MAKKVKKAVKKTKKKRRGKSCVQTHHIIYNSDKNKEVTRKIRNGVHWALTVLRRYNFLTNQEIDTIKLEVELKRRYKDEQES